VSTSVIFWRRTAFEGLERAELVLQPEGLSATSTVICLQAGGFRFDHRWQLDSEWRAQSVTIERWEDDWLARRHASIDGRDAPGEWEPHPPERLEEMKDALARMEAEGDMKIID